MNGLVLDVNKTWLSNAEAQKYLGVSADFLKSLRTNAELHYYKVHNMVFYRKSDIDKLVEKNKVV